MVFTRMASPRVKWTNRRATKIHVRDQSEIKRNKKQPQGSSPANQINTTSGSRRIAGPSRAEAHRIRSALLNCPLGSEHPARFDLHRHDGDVNIRDVGGGIWEQRRRGTLGGARSGGY